MADSTVEDALGGSLCDAPNYLLLVNEVAGRIDTMHGALFSSTDPESLGSALAVALSKETFADALSAVYAAGWTIHTPAGSSSRASSLPAVLRNTDAWVAVGYSPAWRPAQSLVGVRGGLQQRTLQALNRSPVVVSGIGPITSNHAPPRQHAVDVLPTAASTYLILRLLKLT